MEFTRQDGVGYHFLLQGFFLTQGLNLCFLHWQADSLPLALPAKPSVMLQSTLIITLPPKEYTTCPNAHISPDTEHWARPRLCCVGDGGTNGATESVKNLPENSNELKYSDRKHTSLCIIHMGRKATITVHQRKSCQKQTRLADTILAIMILKLMTDI